MCRCKSQLRPSHPVRCCSRWDGLKKVFPGVHALNNCRFELRRGEVHALVGENGAGKSTMMKVLTGIYKRDGGTITYKGQVINLNSPEEAQAMGIGIIVGLINSSFTALI